MMSPERSQTKSSVFCYDDNVNDLTSSLTVQVLKEKDRVDNNRYLSLKAQLDSIITAQLSILTMGLNDLPPGHVVNREIEKTVTSSVSSTSISSLNSAESDTALVELKKNARKQINRVSL